MALSRTQANQSKKKTPGELSQADRIAIRAEGQKNIIGNREVSKTDFETAKGLAGQEQAQGGIITPNVIAALENIGGLSRQQIAQQQQDAAVQAEVDRQDKLRNDTLLKQPNITPSLPVEEQNKITQVQGVAGLNTNTTPITKLSELPKAFLEAGKGTIQNAAQFYDIVKTGLLGGKSTDVKKAEAAFTDAGFILAKDIQLVKEGKKSASEVSRNFELAQSSINDLQRTTKGLGLLSLRYWLDQGKEIEAQILREQTILDNYRVDLNDAIQISRTNSAKLSLGLPTSTTTPLQQ